MKIILGLIITLAAAFANAYEYDTHERMSYVLARAAGLSDEVAKFLSVGNGYIDRTATTSAMLLSSQRQLYHFHGDAAKINTSGHGGTGLFARFVKSKLSLAERNHALGSVFLYDGLKNGDLLMFSAGTHTKMDTFGHAGFSNILGHAPDGHSPDRAFLEPKKYEDMIREMLTSYSALKEVLPAEFIDNKGALDFLNKSAESTYLKRKLTEADMKDPVIIATVMLADTELQSIYREDMYRKTEYKILALERIFESFKDQGKINANVAFDEVFAPELVRNPKFDTTMVIAQSLIANAQSEFLKTLTGKDIFDLPKLLDGQTEESFLRRYKMEVARYESRLREIDNLESRIPTLSGQERKSMEERLQQEKLRLLMSQGASSEMELMSEEYIKARAEELAQLKLAEEMANHLTKDFIPRDKSEYIKHQFEGEYENRHFESHYKDEAYRRFIDKNFGVNWVMEDGKSMLVRFSEAFKKFKSVVTRKPMPVAVEEKWKTMAEKAAADLIADAELSPRERAQVIGFSAKNKFLWFVKHMRYVLRASMPFSGFFYMQKLSAEAKRNAQEHATEDMGKAVRDGKYKSNILEPATAAYRNVMALRAGAKVRCSVLFR